MERRQGRSNGEDRNASGQEEKIEDHHIRNFAEEMHQGTIYIE